MSEVKAKLFGVERAESQDYGKLKYMGVIGGWKKKPSELYMKWEDYTLHH